jgi:hypothetical protein
VKKWLYVDDIYSSSDINYILEGHAMRHIGLSEDMAARLVWLWKLKNGRVRPSGYMDVWKWFWKGWDEYDTRSSW